MCGFYICYPYTGSLGIWTVFRSVWVFCESHHTVLIIVYPTGEVQIHFVRAVCTLCFS